MSDHPWSGGLQLMMTSLPTTVVVGGSGMAGSSAQVKYLILEKGLKPT